MDLPCLAAAEIRVIDPMGLRRPPPSSSLPKGPGFADRLATTVYGAPSLKHWCIWVEPLPAESDRWSQRWLSGVEAALESWSPLLPLHRVDDASKAQILVWRRRPPRRQTPTGWRASNGRSRFSIRELTRAGQRRREPFVEVLVSPDLRATALQSTALHELGHAFGLWGHSPSKGDALAVFQHADPVLTPSPADRITLDWIRSQPNQFGRLGAPLREASTD